MFTVVIASLCDDARSELLKRACASVNASAQGLDCSIVVVANGPRVSPSVIEWLATQPDIRVVSLRSGSHALARRVGAEMADCEFLAFLDDDDELMPGTLPRKLAEFRRCPEIDLLVTDGMRINGSAETKIFPPPEARHPDLIETMMRASWGACAVTLRLSNIDLSAFDPEFRHMEWTLTTLKLASRHRVGYLDEPTYRYYETTPNSLSKKAEHNLALPEVWRRLSMSYAGTRYEATVRRRYGTVCHDVSWQCAHMGRMRDAWRLHGQSLRSPGWLTHLPFTVKLLLAPVRRVVLTSGLSKRTV